MPDRRQHRRRRIRRTVGVASLAGFALAWGVIAGTGSMGASTSTAGATADARSAASAQQQQDQDQQQQLPDLTTRQS